MKSGLLLFILIFVIFFMFPSAMAGSGSTSKADLCHWDRSGAEPERHRHLPGTKTPGWTCGDKGSGDFNIIPGSGADMYRIIDKREPAEPRYTMAQLMELVKGYKALEAKAKTACAREKRELKRIQGLAWPDASWKDEAMAARKVITCMQR